jgi:hypothetical protein
MSSIPLHDLPEAWRDRARIRDQQMCGAEDCDGCVYTEASAIAERACADALDAALAPFVLRPVANALLICEGCREPVTCPGCVDVAMTGNLETEERHSCWWKPWRERRRWKRALHVRRNR